MMKRVFLSLALSVMLTGAILSAAPVGASEKPRKKKEKAELVLVEKRERDGRENKNGSRKPGS